MSQRAERTSSVVDLADRHREMLAGAAFVLGGLTDGVAIHDARGRVHYANEAAARLAGFADARSLLATAAGDLAARFELRDDSGRPLDPDQLPGARVLAGESPPPLLMLVRDRSTGQTWWSLARAHAIVGDDGTPELAVVFWHDATKEKKQREAARVLGEASARLSTSIDYAETLKAVAQALVPDLADWCAVDLLENGDRRSLAVAHADPAKVERARQLRIDYPPDPDARHGVPNVLRTGVPELYPDLSPELLRANARDERQFAAIMDLGLRSFMIVPIVVAGKTEGALTLAAAESGRRFDEADLALACEIGRRAGIAIENARAYGAAQAAIRTRDEFMAVAGHELRTPLAALILQIEGLRVSSRSGALANDPARLLPRLDKTFGHALRLARLIDGLLDVARLSESGVDLEIDDVDLETLVTDTCERFADDAARAGCEVRIAAVGKCVGRWDPHRLEQIVSNLLTNAMKYGAGKPITVTLRCTDSPDGVTMTFEDQGIGIAAEDRERVFGRFERAVSDRNYPGLGLGLWITRELVTAHGGEIDLASEPGRGATLTVRLPREAPSRPAG